jgi:type I restriction enzyme, S subunit
MNVIIGSVGLSPFDGCLSPVYYVLNSRSPNNSTAFFNSLFQIERFHSSLVRFGKGILAHRMRISFLDLKTVMLPIPPLQEQELIADRVENSTRGMRVAILGLQKEIGLLREYRTRLISDVVTGKIDVREEASRLPEIDPFELAEVSAGLSSDEEVIDAD